MSQRDLSSARGSRCPARRLLVVDDNTGLLQTISSMARRLGADVRVCRTLDELDRALPEFVPDTILVDLMMPDVDGIDVVCHVRPCSDAAIYVMTGADRRTLDAAKDVLAASEAKIAGVLHKPFSVAQLAEVLKQQTDTVRPRAPARMPRTSDGALPLIDFERAVNNNRLEAHFQPIVYASGRNLKGFEALARIVGESSATFAEEYIEYLVSNPDLAAVLTDRMIEYALSFLAGLPDHLALTVSVNVFGTQAVADGFRERLLRQCAGFGIGSEQIVLELSEAAVFHFGDVDLRKITQLRLAGFGLSIDDFGTGSSSLARLARLPFSELKIDKSFCLAALESKPAEAVVEACIGLARRLEMKVVAEGVESEALSAKLTRMGCDALQGYHFGKALPAGEARRYAQEGVQHSLAIAKA